MKEFLSQKNVEYTDYDVSKDKEKLEKFEWDKPVLVPEVALRRVNGWRRILQTLFWISAHLTVLSLIIAGFILLMIALRRLLRR